MPLLSVGDALPKSVIEVVPNNGADLKYKIENFAFEKVIYIPKGTYTLTDEILLTGDIASNHPTKAAVIVGSGEADTIIEAAANKNAFHLTNGVSIYIKNLRIDIPNSQTQSAIYGDDDGAQTDWCIHDAVFENLKIDTGGGGACCIELETPFRYNIRGQNKFIVSGAGSAIKIRQTAAVQYGDSKWEGQWTIGLYGNNSIGLDLAGSVTQDLTLIRSDAFIAFMTNGDYTGVTAVKLDKVTNSIFRNIQLEAENTGFDIDDCKNITISDSPFISLLSGATYFKVASTCEDIKILNMPRMLVRAGTTIEILDDDVVSEDHPTVCENWSIIDVGGGTCNWNIQDETIRRLIRGDFGKSENAGVATILSGQSIVDVTHGLLTTPEQIRLLGHVSAAKVADVSRLTSDSGNIGTTTFRIKHQTNVTDDAPVMWSASVNKQII